MNKILVYNVADDYPVVDNHETNKKRLLITTGYEEVILLKEK